MSPLRPCFGLSETYLLSVSGLVSAVLGICFAVLGAIPATMIGLVWAVAFDWLDGRVARGTTVLCRFGERVLRMAAAGARGVGQVAGRHYWVLGVEMMWPVVWQLKQNTATWQCMQNAAPRLSTIVGCWASQGPGAGA
jgi:hypothetical protein